MIRWETANEKGTYGESISVLFRALFDIQSDMTMPFAGGVQPVFNNAGTFRKSVGTGTSSIGIPFYNSGLVEADSGGGDMEFDAPFNNNGTSRALAGASLSIRNGGESAGTFDSAAGGVTRLSGGHLILDPGAVFTGAGHDDVVTSTQITGTIVSPDFRVTTGGTLDAEP